jgi:hypothetical protein
MQSAAPFNTGRTSCPAGKRNQIEITKLIENIHFILTKGVEINNYSDLESEGVF